MKGTWLRILLIFAFVGLIAIGGTWWMMRVNNADIMPLLDAAEELDRSEEPEPDFEPFVPPSRNTITIPGVIEPFESIPISAKLTANISRLLVRDNSTVKKGQLLCVLDDTYIKQDIDRARLALMQAQENLRNMKQNRRAELERDRLSLNRARQDLDLYQIDSQLELQQTQTAFNRAKEELEDAEALFAAKAVSTEEVQNKRDAFEDASRNLEFKKSYIAKTLASYERALRDAELNLELETYSEEDLKAQELSVANAEVDLKERQSRLTDTRITAPIDGTIKVIARTRNTSMTSTGRSSEVLGPGVMVYEGDPFMEIATTECACLHIEVDETDVARLAVGMPAKITGDAFPDLELQGEISAIQTSGRKAGQGVSLFPITVKITSPLKGVRMGMTADVTIELAKEENTNTEGETP